MSHVCNTTASATGTVTAVDAADLRDQISMDIEGEETAALRGSARILAERHHATPGGAA
jgi:hypothetical protein